MADRIRFDQSVTPERRRKIVRFVEGVRAHLYGEKPEPEYVVWRGERWFVADAEFNESPYDIGSHWHLTLTVPAENQEG